MEKFFAMAEIQASLFIYMSVGFLVRRMKIITPEMRGGLTDLLFYILLPCMIFDSFRQDMSAQQLFSASMILVVSACICVFSYIIGKLIYYKYPATKKKILQYGTLIPNSVFAGMPVIKGAYGDIGVFYSSVFIIPNRIFMWSAGISLFTDTDLKTRVKNVLFNPGIIAVALGIGRMLLNINLPSFITDSIENMGLCTTSLSMIIVGTLLADVNIRSVFKRDTFYASFIRLIFLPTLVLVIMRLISPDEVLRGTAVIMTSMPFGASTALLAQKYRADAQFASECVFLTTLLSLITMPIISIFI